MPKRDAFVSTDQLPRGDAVLERLGGVTAPKELQSYVAVFEAIHTELANKQEAVIAAKALRDEGIAAIVSADRASDEAVLDLANALVGARLGNRKNPFRDFSEHTPAELNKLGYKAQIKATRALAKKVDAKRPGKAVTDATRRCTSNAAAQEKAIVALAKPQAAYAKALAARDALLPDWSLALDRLRRKATGAWAEDPEMVETIFAEPSSMEAGRTKRPRKKSTEPRSE